jgi:hypothetical protein
MRGKEALQSANRRAREAEEQLAQLRCQFRDERSTHQAEVIDLKGKLTRLQYDQEQRIADLVADRVAAWRTEYEQKIDELTEESEERSARALELLYNEVSPVILHQVADALAASARDVEAAAFLHNRFGPVNRKTKRAVDRITERKAKSLAGLAETESTLRPAKYSDERDDGGRLGPYQGKANGSIGHS